MRHEIIKIIFCTRVLNPSLNWSTNFPLFFFFFLPAACAAVSKPKRRLNRASFLMGGEDLSYYRAGLCSLFLSISQMTFIIKRVLCCARVWLERPSSLYPRHSDWELLWRRRSSALLSWHPLQNNWDGLSGYAMKLNCFVLLLTGWDTTVTVFIKELWASWKLKCGWQRVSGWLMDCDV